MLAVKTVDLLKGVIALLIMLVFGIFLFISGFRRLSRKRLIENTPTSKTRSLAMGLVEVFGEAVPWKETFKAPLSNNDCVYYKYEIREKSGKRYVTIDSGEKRSPFYLKDETGIVLVDPVGAEIEIPHDVNASSCIGRDPPENIKSYLASRGLKYEGFLGINKDMMFEEWCVALGDKLYVMGAAKDNPFVEDTAAKRSVENIMIKQGEHEKFYYISDRPEKAVLKSFHLKALGAMIGGGFLIVVAAAFLLIILAL